VREFSGKEGKMQQPWHNKIPEEFSPVKNKSKKIWNWKYIVRLFIVLTIASTIKNYQDRRVGEELRESMQTLESNIEALSPYELNHLEDIREKCVKIIGKYLSEEEYTDYMTLLYKAKETDLTSEEIERGNFYYSKVRSKCSSDEKKILDEWDQLIQKLSCKEKKWNALGSWEGISQEMLS